MGNRSFDPHGECSDAASEQNPEMETYTEHPSMNDTQTQTASDQEIEPAAGRFLKHLTKCEICKIERNYCGEGYTLLVQAMKEQKAQH